MLTYNRGDLGSVGERLGARHCSSAASHEDFGDAAQLAMDLRAHADELQDKATKALLLRAAETIDFQGMENELQGMEIGDLQQRLHVVEELRPTAVFFGDELRRDTGLRFLKGNCTYIAYWLAPAQVLKRRWPLKPLFLLRLKTYNFYYDLFRLISLSRIAPSSCHLNPRRTALVSSKILISDHFDVLYWILDREQCPAK